MSLNKFIFWKYRIELIKFYYLKKRFWSKLNFILIMKFKNIISVIGNKYIQHSFINLSYRIRG